MSLFLSPIGNGQQFFDANGVPLNAGLINTYQAGSTTPQATYTTSAGITQNANPIVLSADGRTPNEIWFTSGVAYKFILTDSLSNVLGTYDNLSGINDTSSAPLTEWVASGLTPTYISATSFSVTGNQTLVFQVNQRVKTANTGGTIYSSVSSATYSGGSGLTTIVVVNDSGTLDSGISSVSYGFTNPTYPSVGVAQTALSATNSTNATNLTGSGTIASTTTGGSGLTPALRSYFAGCGMSTAGSSATMSIAAGQCTDSTNVYLMNLSAIAKTTSAWSVGTAAGGLDTGAIANSTWYYFYVIRRADTGVVDILFSTSSSSPTLPANYTQKRYIGAGLTDGSGYWKAFTQMGRDFYWSTPVLDFSSGGSTTAALLTCSLPLGRKMKGYFNLSQASNASSQIYISDPANADLAPNSTSAPLSSFSAAGTGITVSGFAACWTNTSGQIRHREAGTPTTYIVTLGWADLADTNL